MTKTIHITFNTLKRIEAKKNGDIYGKAFYNLRNNAVYGKTIENLRHSWRKTGKQRKRPFEMDIKT